MERNPESRRLRGDLLQPWPVADCASSLYLVRFSRYRQVVASFLVKHLLIGWEEGAAWFWDTLVDADLANNTLGWQWVAGCGADAAPYFRIFNPVNQGAKFDPKGDYIRRWIPELAHLSGPTIHRLLDDSKSTQGVSQNGRGYPAVIVPHKAARERALAAWAAMRPR